MGTINSFTSNLLQSGLFQTSAIANSIQADKSGVVASESGSDTRQLSPLGQVLSQLQRLQKNNPVVYHDITKQIANNLRSVADAAITIGDAYGAKQLNQLSVNFSQASASGQLPDLQSLAQGAYSANHRQSYNHAAPPSFPDAGSSNQALPVILQTLSIAAA